MQQRYKSFIEVSQNQRDTQTADRPANQVEMVTLDTPPFLENIFTELDNK